MKKYPYLILAVLLGLGIVAGAFVVQEFRVKEPGERFSFLYNWVLAEKNEPEENQVEIEPEEEREEIPAIVPSPFKVPDVGKIVRINLDTKKAYLFEDGQLVNTFLVAAIGKTGTPWETPVGDYTIKTKEVSHFSSIGKVWMPYSMQFFGNFFIHGIPTYANGEEVSADYSGGCIRFSTRDAAALFEWATVGTAVSLYREAYENDPQAPQELTQSFFTKNPKLAKPRVSAPSFLVADIETGEVIMGKEYERVRPIASVTKLMTALVSLEIVNQYQKAEVSERAVQTEGELGGLVAHEKIDTSELLYALLLTSSNDAAEALAEHVGRSYFLNSMNEKARAIGLAQTMFKDPSGLSPENSSTARDLFTLAQHIFKHKNYIYDVTKIASIESKTGTKKHVWVNNDPILKEGIATYYGGKHGYTPEAGRTFVGIFQLPIAEFEDRTIVVVLLNSGDLANDTGRLVNYVAHNMYYGVPPGDREAAH